MDLPQNILDDLASTFSVSSFKKQSLTISEAVIRDILCILDPDVLEGTGELDRAYNLARLLFIGKVNNILDVSNNPINNFLTEEELKILDISISDIKEKLILLNAKFLYEGTVDDVYYDFKDGLLDQNKKSFRIRKKTINGIDQYYYTIKRKNKEARLETGLRTSKEKELLVRDPQLFISLIRHEGLIPVRRKVKIRSSFIIEEQIWPDLITSIPGKQVKFDLDRYIKTGESIKPLMEIETDDMRLVEKYIDLLDLCDKKTTTEGSRGLFKRYGAEQQTEGL